MVDAEFFYTFLADSTGLPHQQKAQRQHDDLGCKASLDIYSTPCSHRKTSLMCTIGSNCKDLQVLENLIAAGMNIARLNFRHGTHEWHKEVITMIRQASKNHIDKVGIANEVTIALDTRGPSIHIGGLDGDVDIEVKKGDIMKLTVDKAYMDKGNAGTVYVDYENIIKLIQPEHRIFIADGTIPLIVTGIHGSNIITQVEANGVLSSGRNVFLPGMRLDLPSVSEDDKNDILFGIENGIDLILAGNVRNAADINKLRELLTPNAQHIKIFAKIQTFVAVKHIDRIIDAADGVYIHRLYLGEELPVGKDFIAQKTIVAKCNKKGKPVFVGMGMFSTMQNKQFPSQGESSDVANTIIDGVDGLHISETATSTYPADCVDFASRICIEAEPATNVLPLFHELRKVIKQPDLNTIIAAATVGAAINVDAAAIITHTQTGKIVRALAKFKPPMPIICIVSDEHLAKLLRCHRGCFCEIYQDTVQDQELAKEDWYSYLEDRVNYAIFVGKVYNIIRSGDPVVIAHASDSSVDSTNTIRVEYNSDIVKTIAY